MAPEGGVSLIDRSPKLGCVELAWLPPEHDPKHRVFVAGAEWAINRRLEDGQGGCTLYLTKVRDLPQP